MKRLSKHPGRRPLGRISIDTRGSRRARSRNDRPVAQAGPHSLIMLPGGAPAAAPPLPNYRLKTNGMGSEHIWPPD